RNAAGSGYRTGCRPSAGQPDLLAKLEDARVEGNHEWSKRVCFLGAEKCVRHGQAGGVGSVLKDASFDIKAAAVERQAKEADHRRHQEGDDDHGLSALTWSHL